MKCSSHTTNLATHIEGQQVVSLESNNTTAKIHIGDVGTILKIVIYNQDKIPVIGDTVEIKFKKPNFTDVTVNPLVNPVGELTFTSVAGFFDVSGVWKMQAKVTNTQGSWYSNVKEFKVHNNL